MSNTEQPKKYTPRPYFNVVHYESAMDDEQSQNLNDGSDRGLANPATPTSLEATSDNQEATYEKRWKDLKKHYDEEVTRLRQELRELENSKKESFVPPKTAEEMEAFRKANPDIYDAMLSVVHEQFNNSESNERIRHLEETLAQTQQEKAFAEIEKAHPDYISVVKDPKFLDWIELQDSAIQSWVKTNSNNAKQFIRALDLYKLDAGITSQMPNRAPVKETKHVDTSAADMVSVSGSNSVNVGDTNKRIWTREEIKRMSGKEYAMYEAELDQAMIEGRVR